MVDRKAIKKRESNFEMLARLIKEEAESIRMDMATKDDVANMATKDDIANMATKDDIANMATKDDIAQIRRDMATKVDLEEMEGRIMAKLTPLEAAFDKDARTVIDHGARIEIIESVLHIKPTSPWKNQK